MFLNGLDKYLKSKNIPGLIFIRKMLEDGNIIDPTCTEASFNLLMYADDTILIAESAEELQKSIDALEDYCKLWKLQINSQKTKVMIFQKKAI